MTNKKNINNNDELLKNNDIKINLFYQVRQYILNTNDKNLLSLCETIKKNTNQLMDNTISTIDCDCTHKIIVEHDTHIKYFYNDSKNIPKISMKYNIYNLNNIMHIIYFYDKYEKIFNKDVLKQVQYLKNNLNDYFYNNGLQTVKKYLIDNALQYVSNKEYINSDTLSYINQDIVSKQMSKGIENIMIGKELIKNIED